VDLLQKNPFNTIKANDLNDAEINEQWVDSRGGFFDLFLPKDLVSQYLIGSKGSGKTHLMRYFSYSSQILRNPHSVINGIKKDGYFAVYFQASGLNGQRFESLPFEQEVKSILFQYSYELWCASLVIQALIDVNSKEKLFEDETEFCHKTLDLFNKKTPEFSKVNNLNSLKKLFKDLSNEVDYKINNAYFSPETNVDVLTTRGALIFGIPRLISNSIKAFEGITFLYLIDELENISEEQQKYINTLLREKQLPCTFRLGARAYGIKTFKTLGADEENREGHEYETVQLDNIPLQSNNYEDFAVDLILNRLEKSGFISLEQNISVITGTPQEKKEYLRTFFDEPELDHLNNFTTRDLSSLSKNITSIKKRIESKALNGAVLDEIIENISFSNSPLIESAKVHILAQFWASGDKKPDELLEKSIEIKNHADEFVISRRSDSPIQHKFKYYKNNYIAAALRNDKQNNMDQYLGLEGLLQVTKGFPRHILTVLRNVYKSEVFAGNQPFSGSNKISLKSQRISLLEAAKWFYSECTRECPIGGNVERAMSNLGELFRLEMYADKPVECSASSFTVDESQLSKKDKELLKWATLIRLLIKASSDRQEKNSQKLISKYHMNTLLCPMWGLSVNRRGAISFSPNDISIIFSNDERKNYINLRNAFDDSRNLPFKVVSGIEQIGMDF